MYENFEKLLKMHNVSAYKVGKETGIASSTFTDWKTGRSIPKQEKLKKIADYFNISIDELMGNESTAKNDSVQFKNENQERLEVLQVNEDLRILFDSAVGLSKKDIKFVLELVERMKGEKEK